MEFPELLSTMTQAACAGDGAAVAACFTPSGLYHDVFYGSFRGSGIMDLIEGHFHRDGSDFRWDLHDPVASDGVGYARYVFSYASQLPAHKGKRALFEGVALCRLQDGLISDYREVATAATGLSLIGFDEARIARFIAREARALCERPEAASHLGSA